MLRIKSLLKLISTLTPWKVNFIKASTVLGWVDDIDQAFVSTHFKLFARIFVFVSRTNNCVQATFSWSGTGPATEALYVLQFQQFSAAVNCTMFVCFQTDTDFCLPSFSPFRLFKIMTSSSRKPTRLCVAMQPSVSQPLVS